MGKPDDLKTDLKPADTSKDAALREMYAGINDKHMFPVLGQTVGCRA